VVGLYVNPPEHAIVLSVDEKSQIQALDRTQPGLRLKKGRAMTQDYKRNGTTTLFAAFDVLEGKVIGRCMQKHRHQGRVGLAKADMVGRDDVEAIRQERDQVAEHEARRGKAVQQEDRRAFGRFAIEDLAASDAGVAVGDGHGGFVLRVNATRG
jgi:hypothetical protein